MGSTRVYVKANNENDCTFQANHGHSMEPRRRESFMVLSKAPGAETGVGSIATGQISNMVQAKAS